MGGSAIGGESLFEFFDFGAKNKTAVRKYPIENISNFRLQGPVLRRQVYELDFHAASIFRNRRAGFPATMTLSGTSLVTPHKIVTLVPIDAPFFTCVLTTLQSASVCKLPSAFAELGYLSLINDTLWPTKTLSSISTPSQ